MVQLTITFKDGTRLIPNEVMTWMVDDGLLTIEYKTMYAHYPLCTIKCFTVLKRST